MTQKEPFSFQRALWKLTCLVLGLLLAGMAVLTAGFGQLLEQVRCAPDHAAPSLSSSGSLLRDFLDPTDVNWQQLRADLTRQDTGTVNLLLIGHDRREGDSLSRADALILCTFDREAGRLTMTSFLRDTWLTIPGRGKDRLNAAYAYGGTALLKQTLSENYRIPIDGCLEVDFSQFAGVIDALGGVTLSLRADEADFINRNTGSSLTEGPCLLTGQEALTYARIRTLDADGDFSRTGRQRKVVSAVVDAYRDAGLSSLLKLLKQVLPMLSTDMTESRLLMLALDVFPMLSGMEIASQTVPGPGSCTDETINGMAVLVPDLEAARTLLRETAKTN